MKSILFIGSFLSSSTGTISVVEKLGNIWVKNNTFKLQYSSRKNNKIFRLINIIYDVFTFKGDLIHIDVFSGFSLIIPYFAASISYLKCKKIYLTLRGGGIPFHYKKNKFIYDNLFKFSNKISSPSKFIIINLPKKYNINYLPNPIDKNLFKPPAQSVKRVNLLWVRAFSKIYNPKTPINALKILIVKYPNLKLTMVGPDKGELSKCQKLIKKLKLENNINILGHIDHYQLPEIYKNHYIYLNTTSFESFGSALCEAAACQMVIISSIVGEIPLTWEDKKNILFFKNKDHSDLASKIEFVLSNPIFSESISKESLKRIQCYSTDVISEKWIDYLNQGVNS
ncbi:MAG: glycosyltransferase [Prochlorococcus marinus CUG1435]|nr:glycosyltransferase [Prochlorococcus marinus CUG1435]